MFFQQIIGFWASILKLSSHDFKAEINNICLAKCSGFIISVPKPKMYQAKFRPIFSMATINKDKAYTDVQIPRNPLKTQNAEKMVAAF